MFGSVLIIRNVPPMSLLVVSLPQANLTWQVNMVQAERIKKELRCL
jgi:hypothetical protein